MAISEVTGQRNTVGTAGATTITASDAEMS